MTILVFAFLIGVIAGLRAMTAPAVVAWGAGLGWLPLQGTHLNFLCAPATRWILSVLAVGEIINDKLPKTPSRTVPPQFIARIVMGGFSGAALGLARGSGSSGSWIGGLLCGAVGAVAGTLAGAKCRGALVKAIGGKDLPIALLEDVIAIVGAVLIVSHA
jgi:uncharacterized membrane protein